MAKISKNKLSLHNQALELVRSDKALTMTEKEFVIKHYKPYATHNVTETNAFFTPIELAMSLNIESPSPWDFDRKIRVIDLCAGIGLLSFAYYHYNGFSFEQQEHIELVCVEYEAEYVEVGKKLLPEATWIQGDILDPKTTEGLGQFDCFLSNPPFMKMGNYKGTYTTAILGIKLAEYGVMIVPQCNCDFKLSGTNFYEKVYNREYDTFEDNELIGFRASCIDTTEIYDENDKPVQWENAKVTTEIVVVDNLRTHPRVHL